MLAALAPDEVGDIEEELSKLLVMELARVSNRSAWASLADLEVFIASKSAGFWLGRYLEVRALLQLFQSLYKLSKDRRVVDPVAVVKYLGVLV